MVETLKPTQADRYATELREIAGMVAQSPDGPLRWKQYRLTAIADFLATRAIASEAEREIVEAIESRTLPVPPKREEEAAADTPPRGDINAQARELLDAECLDLHHGCGLMISTYRALRAIEAALQPLSEVREVKPHVFLDCDGVLADFDTYAEAYFGMPPREYEKQVGGERFWRELEAKGDFYRNLPLMPDALALYEAVKHLHPTILTGCPRGNWAQGQKVAWAAEHFPGVPIITCRSADKRDFAKPGDVLIDDWAQHRHRWIEMGGVFITHHDAETSIAALKAHYPALATLPPATLQGGKA